MIGVLPTAVRFIERLAQFCSVTTCKIRVYAKRAALFIEQFQHFVTEQHVLVKRHRPNFGDDDFGVAAHLIEPSAELLGI